MDPQTLQKSSALTLVLIVLRDSARHGYDIAREVERRSANAILFNHGTLYPVLHALEKNGLVASTWEQPDGERRRRVYALTEKGQIEAQKAVSEWNAFAEAMQRVIQGGPDGQPI